MNKTNILLSFIIPVYNVEKYLDECITSIRNQMTDFCEIILVNDGSTDSSGEICRRYADFDYRIKVYNQENQGASIARNKGLLNANGKYVTFVDSDDKIAPDSIKEILLWITKNETDMCFLQISKLYPNGKLEDMGECILKDNIYSKNKNQVMFYLATRPKFSGAACAKLYNRNFIIDNGIFFPNDGLIGEDLVFVRDVLLCGNTFDVLDFHYYEYRQFRVGSVTNTVSYRNFSSIVRFIETSVRLFCKNNLPIDFISKCAMSFVAYEYVILLWQYIYLEDKEKENAYQWLKRYTWVLGYAKNFKYNVVGVLVNTFGIKSTAICIYIFRSLSKLLKRCQNV